MVVVITIQGSGLALLEEATRSLGSEAKARRAFTRAINRTGLHVERRGEVVVAGRDVLGIHLSSQVG